MQWSVSNVRQVKIQVNTKYIFIKQKDDKKKENIVLKVTVIRLPLGKKKKNPQFFYFYFKFNQWYFVGRVVDFIMDPSNHLQDP